MSVSLKSTEQIEDLGNGLKVIQDKNGFCFGTDAVALANFAAAKPKERLMDFCTGTAIVPVLLCGRTRCADMTALEIQPEVCDMARRTVELNGLTGRIRVELGDLRQAASAYEAGSFDVVTCNPPYMRPDSGKINHTDSLSIARHELLCTLENVVENAAFLLKSGGRFYIVHRTERLADLIYLMKQFRLEPKRMQLVHPDAGRAPKLVLVEGQKDRKSGLVLMEPLYVNQ